VYLAAISAWSLGRLVIGHLSFFRHYDLEISHYQPHPPPPFDVERSMPVPLAGLDVWSLVISSFSMFSLIAINYPPSSIINSPAASNTSG
jgi:hypothetical protein